LYDFKFDLNHLKLRPKQDSMSQPVRLETVSLQSMGEMDRDAPS